VPPDFPSAGEPSGPVPPHEMRASDADRDRVMDVLRDATAEGRLTADELDERLAAALTARTFGDLAALTEDLPVGPDLLTGPDVLTWPDEPSPEAPAPAEDVLRIDQRGGSFHCVGGWVVPRRIELRPSWCDVLLDFTAAVLTHDMLRIDMRMRGGSLVLVARPGMVVNDDALWVRYTDLKNEPSPWPGGPVVLRVRLVGRMRYGWIETRWPRRPPG
jgi:hypothetical protein